MKYLLYIIFFILISFPLKAQHPEVFEEERVEKESEQEIHTSSEMPLSTPNRHFMTSFGYSQVSPLGQFKKNTDNVFHGFSSSIGWFLDRQNLYMGFFWNFHVYDYVDYYYSDGYSESVAFGFDQFMTNIRFITNDGVIQPYVESFIGLNWLYIDSQSHLSSIFSNLVEDYEDEDINNSSIDNSASLAYGIGAGILLPLDFKDPNGSGIYIELGARYAFSTDTRYLTTFDLDDYSSSNTNNFTFNLAFVMIF